ncbi:MAG: tetratricopeptide repeat protein [Bacteroidetes bacterium]|nr:tetratricopeptide repeat protein [Bacteroidota bacterium]
MPSYTIRLLLCVLISLNLTGTAKTFNHNSDSLLALIQKHHGHDTTLARLINDYIYEIKTNDPQRALEYARQCLQLSKEINFKNGESDSYYQLSSIYQDYHNYNKAIEYGKMALQIDRIYGDSSRIASSLSNMGSIFQTANRYKEASQYFIQALRYVPLSLEYKRAGIYISIGVVFYNQLNLPLAQKYYEDALRIARKYNDLDNIARAEINLAVIYESQNRFDKALHTYFGTLKQLNSRDLQTEADICNNVAGIYYHYEKMDSCLYYVERAKNIRLKLHDTSGVAEINVNIASLYDMQGKKDLAIATYLEGADYAKKTHHISLLQAVYKDLSDIYSSLKQYDKAYEYQRQSDILKDSLYNAETLKQVTDMQTKYDSELKENQISLLNKQKELTDSEIARQRTMLLGMLGMIVVLGIAGILAYRAYKTKKKTSIELSVKNHEIESQRVILEEKNKEITDSIHYASRIQKALITSDEYLSQNLPEHFIFYKPKDIVSGDFYWALSTDANTFFLATADCTGHGVPGAFMSLLNISILNEIIIERRVQHPDLVLNEARKEIIKALNPKGSEEAKDGMDCILCAFDLNRMVLNYAAANNSFYIVRNQEVIVCKADKMPVGKSPKEGEPFTRYSFDLQKGDVIYTLTDGYADQFGGDKGKKFKYKQLEDLFRTIHTQPMAEQKSVLDKIFTDWKGKLEQVDDVLIIGLRL